MQRMQFTCAMHAIGQCTKVCSAIVTATAAAGYGQESHSRVQRQQIPHHIYKDSHGVEHVRVSSLLQACCGGWVPLLDVPSLSLLLPSLLMLQS